MSHGTRLAHGGIVANKVVIWNRRDKTGSQRVGLSCVKVMRAVPQKRRRGEIGGEE